MPLLSPTVPAEQLRILLAQHISNAPELVYQQELSDVDLHWIGKAESLIEAAGNVLLSADFRRAKTALGTFNHDRNALLFPLISAHARVELQCPADSQGLFIGPGQTFEGYSAVVRILSEESRGFLIVDPYLNGQVFCDLIPHVAGKTSIKFLTTENYKASLDAAFNKWETEKQNPAASAAVRYAQKGALHDRMIIKEPSTVWLISQSLKDIAKKSPATLTQPDSDTGSLKISFYSQLWEELKD